MFFWLFSISVYNAKGLGDESYLSAHYIILDSPEHAKVEMEFGGFSVRSMEQKRVSDNCLFTPSHFYIYIPSKNFKFMGGVYRRYWMDFDISSDTIEKEGYRILRKVHSRGGINSLFISPGIEMRGFYIYAVSEIMFGKCIESWEAIFDGKTSYPDSFFYSFQSRLFPMVCVGYRRENSMVYISYGTQRYLDVSVVEWYHTDTSALYSTTIEVPSVWRIFLLYQNLYAGVVRGRGMQMEGGIRKEVFDIGLCYRKWGIEDVYEYGAEGWYHLRFENARVSFGLGIGKRGGGQVDEIFLNLYLRIGFFEKLEKRKRLWGG